MKLLLDTHALLWSLLKDGQLPKATRDIIEVTDTVFVSAVSIWEICNKYHVGKLASAAPIVPLLEQIVAEKNFTGLPITLAHASHSAMLPDLHRDPWDRMLVAQALGDDLTLVSNETLFDGYGVKRLW